MEILACSSIAAKSVGDLRALTVTVRVCWVT